MDIISKSEYSNPARIEALLSEFENTFNGAAEVVVRVPGRVNLIGEHIDYCGYAVHPMAIDQDILVAVKRRDDNKLVLK